MTMELLNFENTTGFKMVQDALTKMKSKPLCLLIDDQKVDYRADITARTFEAGLYLLTILGVEYLILDHDLGYTDERNGALILKFVLHSGMYPNVIEFNSLNSAGLNNMKHILTDYNMYNPISGLTFKRK